MSRRINACCTVFALWLGTSTASAQSTESMLAGCRSVAKARVTSDGRIALGTDFPAGECWGAFAVIQSFSVVVDAQGTRLFGACPPADGTRTQLVAVFLKYADDHPARWHEEFLDFALEALRVAFPCKKGK